MGSTGHSKARRGEVRLFVDVAVYHSMTLVLPISVFGILRRILGDGWRGHARGPSVQLRWSRDRRDISCDLPRGWVYRYRSSRQSYQIL